MAESHKERILRECEGDRGLTIWELGRALDVAAESLKWIEAIVCGPVLPSSATQIERIADILDTANKMLEAVY